MAEGRGRPPARVFMPPQGNASSGMGVERRAGLPSVYDLLVDQVPIQDVLIRDVNFPGMHLVPSNRDLVGAEIELVDAPDRELRLRTALEPIREDERSNGSSILRSASRSRSSRRGPGHLREVVGHVVVLVATGEQDHLCAEAGASTVDS